MDYEPIRKGEVSNFLVKPNLADYQKTIDAFQWEDINRELDGFDGGGLNIAYEVLDRHIKTPLKDKIALYWEGKGGESEAYTFHDLSRLTNRFANALTNLGTNKGDRIFAYMDRTPEIFISLLGALKMGGVIGPLFSAFGPDAVKDRLVDSEARVLITTPKLVTTVHEILDDLPALEKIIVVNREKASYEFKDKELSYESLMQEASEVFEIEKTDKEDYAIMHYTSGTTGKPKGVAHVHEAVVGHYATAKYVLDLHPEDIYWCTADPGWITGHSYIVYAPLMSGITTLMFEGAPNYPKPDKLWKVVK
ncbi:MAG: AMP-binding protein, partial [Desulfatiglandales bacterium]|nr:AMP-binding protein [Desulfatiglandales bacterium]